MACHDCINDPYNGMQILLVQQCVVCEIDLCQYHWSSYHRLHDHDCLQEPCNDWHKDLERLRPE